jgi:hypothetical protein
MAGFVQCFTREKDPSSEIWLFPGEGGVVPVTDKIGLMSRLLVVRCQLEDEAIEILEYEVPRNQVVPLLRHGVKAVSINKNMPSVATRARLGELHLTQLGSFESGGFVGVRVMHYPQVYMDRKPPSQPKQLPPA